MKKVDFKNIINNFISLLIYNTDLVKNYYNANKYKLKRELTEWFKVISLKLI